MKYFDNLSIKNKLTSIILSVTVFAVLLGFTIEILNDIKNFRKELKNTTIMIAEVIGEYSLSDLIFEDKLAAKKTLVKLDKISSIKNAVIYDAEGKIFSVYNKPGFDEAPPEEFGDPGKFKGQYLLVFQPIINSQKNQDNYGTIYLRASTERMQQDIFNHAFTMILLIMSLIIVSYILAVKFQGIVSEPILHLANVAKSISKKGDYSIRVETTGHDETGILYAGFNDMLDQIQSREMQQDKAEAALRESEERYFNIFQTVPVSIWEEDFSEVKKAINDLEIQGVTDFHKYFDEHPEFVIQTIKMVKILDVNEETLKIYGARNKNELLESLKKIFPPESLQVFQAQLIAIAEEKTSFEAEVFTHSLQGKNIDILLKWAISSNTDEFGKLLVTVIDITERKQAAAALEKSEKNYRNLVDNALVGIYRSTIKGEILYVNEAMVRMFEFDSAEELIFEGSFARYKNLNDREIFLEKIKETGKVEGYEFEYRTKFGKIINVLVSAKLEGDELSGIFLNISDLKHGELVLQESEEKFRRVIRQSNDGIYVLQEDRFVFINPRFTEITGYEWEEINTDDFDFNTLITEEALKVFEEREELRKRGEEPPGRYIFKAIRKDGAMRDLEVSVTLIEWEGSPGTLGMFHDVTDRIQTQEKLTLALAEAKQANSVKDLFLANMSHEIRTPLNSIMGFSDLIESGTRHLVSEREKEYFDVIRNSGTRLMQTIHGIIDISQIEAGAYSISPETFDLYGATRNMVKEFELVANNKKLKLEFNSDLDSAFIHADRYGVIQSLNNIIDNAIKYTDQGAIMVVLKKESEHFVLSLQDTGVGIAKKYLAKLYDAFSQESEGYTKKYQGIGLGLAITKRHLDMNKIDINVKSIKGIGTTFILTFTPAQKALYIKQEEQKETQIKAIDERTEKPLILLVEDDINSQKLIEDYLMSHSELCIADSVSGAKDQLKKRHVDMVLLDLSLEGDEDGLDLVRWMRKTNTWKQTPVIATTAHAFTTDRDNCLAAGCDDYMSKPIRMKELLNKIENIL